MSDGGIVPGDPVPFAEPESEREYFIPLNRPFDVETLRQLRDRLENGDV